MHEVAMLDWDDLRFFLAIARHNTLSAAAKHLQVTQSTVSRRLASLQEKMGVRLLQRAADGYVLTLAGESIRAHVERVETETLSVERAVAGHDTRLEGLVRVTSSCNEVGVRRTLVRAIEPQPIERRVTLSPLKRGSKSGGQSCA
jgi:DNA-binding transcriptional LysR family regulator